MKYDNIIIGAGPAGIQLAYFFSKLNINYVILERNNIAGSFFDRFPHSGKLISINKRYVGKDIPDFKLRHDWNSLLSDKNLLFTDYSKDFYPDKKDMVRYLNDFAIKNNLNIIYGSEVLVVDKENDNYKLKIKNKDNLEEIYECNKLICATGLSKPIYLNQSNKRIISYDVVVPIKHYYDFDKDYFLDEENLKKYINKKVLIIGGGNAGYELANILNNYASHIRILQSQKKNYSISSNYTGDIRAVYLSFLDTFYLKSLNSIYDTIDILITQKDKDSQYKVVVGDLILLSVVEHYFDFIICTTGWKFDDTIFNFSVDMDNNKKYPKINYKYESNNNKNLFFIGTLMHSLDYKVSSGGFIHGFRYLIKYFVNLNYDRNFDIKNFNYTNLEEITDHIMYKINNSSPMYQMHSVMCDLICFDKNTKEIEYYNDVVNDFYFWDNIIKNKKDKLFINITLEFSKVKVVDIQKLNFKHSIQGFENNSKLLHPIFRIYSINNNNLIILIEEHHLDEDIDTEFIEKFMYNDRILRILRMFIY